MSNEISDESNEENERSEKPEESSDPSDDHPRLVDGMLDESDDETPIGSYTKPKETNTKELDSEEVREYFSKKGSVEIFAQLADGPKRFSEINNALPVSRGTIATRLTQGAKLHLWREYFQYPDDGGKIKLYEISPVANPLAEIVDTENIRETTKRLRQIKQRHADALANFRTEIWNDDSSK